MSSCEQLLHLIIIVISALLGTFEQNQSMVVLPRCVGIRPHVWFPMNFAAVAMVMGVLPMTVEIGNLINEAKQILAQKIFHFHIGLVNNSMGFV